jgi:hypothetical protein
MCIPLKVTQCFRGTCCLHFHSQRISQAGNHCEAVSKHSLLVDFQQTYGIVSQKIKFSITTHVRTSNPTCWYPIDIPKDEDYIVVDKVSEKLCFYISIKREFISVFRLPNFILFYRFVYKYFD